MGIKENKEKYEIQGVENANNIIKDFWNIINNKQKVSKNILNSNCVEIMEVENKKIIIINIPKANRRDKPIYINNNPIAETFKRFYNGDYRCTRDEVKAMIKESI